MKLAVLLAKDAPSNNRKLPDEWPVCCAEVDDNFESADPRLIIMTEEELNKWRADRMEQYKAWQQKRNELEKSRKPLWRARHQAKRAWIQQDPDDEELREAFEKAHAEAEAQELAEIEEPISLFRMFNIPRNNPS